MSHALLCVVIYDVPDDRRRTRLFKLLKQYGTAQQYSAFEARLTLAERRQLIRECNALLCTKTDRLVIYPIGKEQERGILEMGPARIPVEAPQFFLV